MNTHAVCVARGPGRTQLAATVHVAFIHSLPLTGRQAGRQAVSLREPKGIREKLDRKHAQLHTRMRHPHACCLSLSLDLSLLSARAVLRNGCCACVLPPSSTTKAEGAAAKERQRVEKGEGESKFSLFLT